MAPTHGDEEIEGRYKERKAYKERPYAYSPVPASSSTEVHDTTTLDRHTDRNGAGRYDHRLGSTTINGVNGKCPVNNMAEKGSTTLQYVAAAAANLCTMAAGAMLGWTSPVLPKLMKNTEDSPLGRPIDQDENSWIGSLVAIGAMIGCFVAGWMSEKFGRKRTLLSAVVPFTIGWILIASAKVVIQLCVARVFLGFAMAFAFTVVPMYCGEIAETSVRGALGSFLQLFITFGLLYSYAIGPYVSYTVLWILCGILPIIFFGCFITMPESPYYLLKIGQREEAIASLARLRSLPPASVQKEADEMQVTWNCTASIMDLFTVKANFKAMVYTSLLAMFQQLSGINVVLFYMEGIFISAGTSLSTSVATIIVGAVQTIASCVTPVVVDRLGRKLLLIISGIGEIVTLCALGTYFYLKDALHSDVSSISILPILSLVIFIATYCLGWGPLPWTMMGEMLATNVKSKASSIAVCMCWLLAFFITKFSGTLSESFGNYTLYWLFAVFCVISVVFTVMVLPETKGKNLQQIQDELNGVSPRVSDFESGKM
ncbi:Facilitated trehalose transporter Tret1 [Dufourea novaeangliae]|uniref:Facilitated trehalose transporter Tret1 n=1 Tax=Dufourea novaeangliae TaxID=178035 RepID=A0A154PHJ7_DUFNO|nr:Facilitated trehalose transporter Tret1 [Dufourea novaeangliae]